MTVIFQHVTGIRFVKRLLNTRIVRLLELISPRDNDYYIHYLQTSKHVTFPIFLPQFIPQSYRRHSTTYIRPAKTLDDAV